MDNVPNCTKEALCAAIGGSSSRVVIFLDYDGTLAPIVDEPDKAFISEECRAMLRVLATVYPVALVSGRSNDKLKNFVQLEELILAGSHGVHIVGPRGEPIAGPDPEAMVGADALAALDAARTALDAELASIQGYLTEDNVYCISAHYRMVAAEEHERVRAAVHATLARFPSLCHKEGKMVHELRPAIDWNKGKAVEWLLAMMRRRRLGGVEGAADAEVQLLPIYLGDDVADVRSRTPLEPAPCPPRALVVLTCLRVAVVSVVAGGCVPCGGCGGWYCHQGC